MVSSEVSSPPPLITTSKRMRETAQVLIHLMFLSIVNLTTVFTRAARSKAGQDR